jgi:hypothetical protein
LANNDDEIEKEEDDDDMDRGIEDWKCGSASISIFESVELEPCWPNTNWLGDRCDSRADEIIKDEDGVDGVLWLESLDSG